MMKAYWSNKKYMGVVRTLKEKFGKLGHAMFALFYPKKGTLGILVAFICHITRGYGLRR